MNKLILSNKPGYRIEGIYFHTEDNKLEILANGACFIDHVNYYYKNQKNQNRIICLTYATAELSSNWGYNIDDIVTQTQKSMRLPGVVFVNLKNFKRKIIF